LDEVWDLLVVTKKMNSNSKFSDKVQTEITEVIWIF